jgi:putative membrane protein
MMWGYGPGYGPGWMGYGGGFVMLLFMLLILAAIVMLVVALTRRERYANFMGSRTSTGLAVLEERYAKGEIQREEYLQKRSDLLSSS